MTRLYQKPTPRNLSPVPGFRRDVRWRRKWVRKALEGLDVFWEGISNGELMRWVCALGPRRGGGVDWTDDEQRTVNEMEMRAWRPIDLEQRRAVQIPTWLHRELVHHKYHPLIGALHDAYRAGSIGLLISYNELVAWLGMSRSTVIRWIDHLVGRGLIVSVSTCLAPTGGGRRRDNSHNLYQLGPALFDAVGTASLDGLGRDKTEQAINRKHASHARRVARDARTARREAAQETQQRATYLATGQLHPRVAARLVAQGRSPDELGERAASPPARDSADVGESAKSGASAPTFPSVKKTAARLRDRAVAVLSSCLGSVILTPQRPCLDAGSETVAPRVQGLQPSTNAATPQTDGKVGADAPDFADSPTSAESRAGGDAASGRERRPEIRSPETPPPPRPATQSAASGPAKPGAAAAPDDWRRYLGGISTYVRPNQVDVCPECDGSGWGKRGFGWDASRKCRPCRGSGRT